MKISYLVCCHNETLELLTLIEKLKTHIDTDAPGDEVVILDDFSDNEDTKKILEKASSYGFKVVRHALNRHFGNHKTFGSRSCSGDYIFQLDADECPSPFLLINLRDILEANPTVDLFRVPRVNLLRGVTMEDALKWGWNVSTIQGYGHDDVPIINWDRGDYQTRIYKNCEAITWRKPLHEVIDGAKISTILPKEPEFAIIHDKTIERQRAQNEFYNKHWSQLENQGFGT